MKIGLTCFGVFLVIVLVIVLLGCSQYENVTVQFHDKDGGSISIQELPSGDFRLTSILDYSDFYYKEIMIADSNNAAKAVHQLMLKRVMLLDVYYTEPDKFTRSIGEEPLRFKDRRKK